MSALWLVNPIQISVPLRDPLKLPLGKNAAYYLATRAACASATRFAFAALLISQTLPVTHGLARCVWLRQCHCSVGLLKSHRLQRPRLLSLQIGGDSASY